MKASSILSTTVALQYADFCRIDPKHKIIETAIGYLIDNFHSDEEEWKRAKIEWAGKITLETLSVLKYFDLIKEE